MRRTVLNSLAALLLAAGALAGSVDIGHQTYNANCAACHGTVPDQLIIPSVMNGANNPGLIRAQINSYDKMRQLSFLTDNDLDNIATYLGHYNTTDADRTFDWGEKTFPTLLKGTAQTGTVASYYYRFYAETGIYVGTQGDASTGGHVFYFDPASSPDILDLGSILSFLPSVQAAGF